MCTNMISINNLSFIFNQSGFVKGYFLFHLLLLLLCSVDCKMLLRPHSTYVLCVPKYIHHTGMICWTRVGRTQVCKSSNVCVCFFREFIAHIPSEMTFLFLLQLFRNSDLFFCGKKCDDNNNSK